MLFKQLYNLAITFKKEFVAVEAINEGQMYIERKKFYKRFLKKKIIAS